MNFQITEELSRRAKLVNDNGRNVIPHQDIFYYHSILYSAECAINAFEKYEYFLTLKEVTPTHLVSSIHEAISHVGSLSFYFFNTGGRASKYKPQDIVDFIKNRSNSFREEFNLNDDSALKNRNLRNMFEHFDEKLDIYLLNTLAGTFYPMPKLGKHTDVEEKILDKNFKLLDIKSKCLVLFNEKFFFGDMQKEVYDVYSLAYKKCYNITNRS